MNPPPISAGQASSFAWATFKHRSGLFMVALLTIFGAWGVLEIAVIAGQSLGLMWWVGVHLMFLFFFAGIEVGLLQIGLALYDGRAPNYADLFKYFALGPKFLIGQLAYLIMVGLGLMLFIALGVYLGVRYSLFGFGLLTREANLIRSFQQSAILSTGRQGYLLAILVALLGLNLLGASLLGLGLLVTVPLSVLTLTAVYRQLSVR